MGRHLLGARAAGAATQRGFTLIETMVAMAIGVVVLLANIALINTAHKNLAHAKSITAATDLATSKLADFRAMTIPQITAASPTDLGGGAHSGNDSVTVDGLLYERSWVVSSIDLNPAAPPAADLVGDLVKIRVDVAWISKHVPVAWTPENNGRHHVLISTLTTGAAP